MGLGHHFSRVSHAAGPAAAARGPFRAPGLCPPQQARERRGGERPSKWGRSPIARPRALGDSGSNRKEREMKGSIVCTGKDLRVCGRAADQ
jgi:hypothetical protein